MEHHSQCRKGVTLETPVGRSLTKAIKEMADNNEDNVELSSTVPTFGYQIHVGADVKLSSSAPTSASQAEAVDHIGSDTHRLDDGPLSESSWAPLTLADICETLQIPMVGPLELSPHREIVGVPDGADMICQTQENRNFITLDNASPQLSTLDTLFQTYSHSYYHEAWASNVD